MPIYLTNEAKFDGVINLTLSEIKFTQFSLDLKEFDLLIITSKNALKALEVNKIKLNLKIKLYVVGEKTAQYALNLGFKNIKIAKKAYADELFKEFKEEFLGKKCLYLRAEKIASALPDLLLQKGVDLKEMIAYKNSFKNCDIKLKRPFVVILTSPLNARYFLKCYEIDKLDKMIALGLSTAKALKEFELSNEILVPKTQSLKACVELAKSSLF